MQAEYKSQTAVGGKALKKLIRNTHPSRITIGP